jgi:large subunit ribosomal protein L31e
MADKPAEQELERIYVVPLSAIKKGRSSCAAPRAVNEVRAFLVKHMKVEKKNVWIDDSVNKELWGHGKYWIPSKIRVRAVKFDDGVVEATLPELAEKTSRREILKEEKEKKTPILKKEEAPAEEGVAGAEDYTIKPTADGEVKIKKKKTAKEGEEAEKEEAPEKPAKEAKPEAPKAEEAPAEKPKAVPKKKAEPAEKPKKEAAEEKPKKEASEPKKAAPKKATPKKEKEEK